MLTIDERNTEILTRRQAFLAAEREAPVVGDVVEMPDGTIARATHVWTFEGGQAESVQTGKGGSFYLGEDYVSFSGSLDPAKPVGQFVATGRTAEARFWFFDHDIWGAGRGVEVVAEVPVWRLNDNDDHLALARAQAQAQEVR